jgi:hypothetical protein
MKRFDTDEALALLGQLMTAPESVVRAVMRATNCHIDPDEESCWVHGSEVRNSLCQQAVRSADAAFAASLEWAADEADRTAITYEGADASKGTLLRTALLRRWARGER